MMEASKILIFASTIISSFSFNTVPNGRASTDTCKVDKPQVCLDCKTFDFCNGLIPVGAPQTCPHNEVCLDGEVSECVMQTSPDDKCSCSAKQNMEYFVDCYDSIKYVMCIDDEPIISSCDPEQPGCEIIISNGPLDCGNNQLQIASTDCGTYEYCSNGSPAQVICTSPLIFNDITGDCSNPNGSPNTPSFTCPDAGIFPNDKNCTTFYQCPNGVDAPNEYSCSDGEVFEETQCVEGNTICPWEGCSCCNPLPLQSTAQPPATQPPATQPTATQPPTTPIAPPQPQDCSSEGQRFEAGYCVQEFYECQFQGATYEIIQRECPEGYVFNPTMGYCSTSCP